MSSPTIIQVATEAQLNQAIATVDAATTGSFLIQLTTSITEGTDTGASITFNGNTLSAPPDLYALNLQSGVTVTIDGQGHTLNGAGIYRGIFAYAGAISIENLQISRVLTQGGNANLGGGGGAGLGGGLFVGSGAQVTLAGVTFNYNTATGGSGKSGDGGAGGGLGGAGYYGGGGVGSGATGALGYGGYGIILGTANGGGGGTFAGGGGVNPIGVNGGFGGGAGINGDNTGAGGFGGGGSSEQGYGGAGGFGGGGGGGDSAAHDGAGGFGAGSGGSNSGTPTGGGGLGAGGAIFVQQGGTLTFDAGSIAGSVGVHGGSSGGGSAAAGSALGSGIFLQGNETITFAPSAGQTLQISGAIADQSGSGGIGANAGSGAVVIDGDGTVELLHQNTYTGGTTVDAGTLELGNPGAAGSGTITLASNTILQIDGTVMPTNTIAGFGFNNEIVLSSLHGQSATLGANDVLTLTEVGGTTVTLQLQGNYAGDTFAFGQNGLVKLGNATLLNVGNEQELNQAIATVDAASSGSYTIVFTADITEGTDTGDSISFNGKTLAAPPDLYALNVKNGVSLTINGAGYTVSGASKYRGIFAYAGAVTIRNLAIDNALAQGGVSLFGGGGGAGLGGGLFVASGAQVTLSGVSFSTDQAQGGSGTLGGSTGGAGGGLGGVGNLGGGGIGADATGGFSGAGGYGVVLGAANGGGGGSNNGAGGGIGASGDNGGFGGGGGTAGTQSGSGGFGGGGGSAGSSGGSGGFGGGGGGGAISGGGGGFGAGNGAGSGNERYGGGGLGAGGAIFVEQGGTLIMEGTSGLSGGSVKAGTSGGGSATGGSAFGGGIFVQGNDILTFAPGAGQTLTISDVIADQSGSGGTGAGAVLIEGPGTVVLGGTNTFTGGTTVEGAGAVLSITKAQNLGALNSTLVLDDGTTLLVNGTFTLPQTISVAGDPAFDVATGKTVTTTAIVDGATPGDVDKTGGGTLKLGGTSTYSGGTTIEAGTLELSNPQGAGSGPITLGAGGLLKIDGTTMPTNTIEGFAHSGDEIALANIHATSATIDANDVLTVNESGGGSVTLQLQGDFTDDSFAIIQLGNGSAIANTVIDVANELELNQAIATIDAAGSGHFTIRFTADITEGTDTGNIVMFNGNAQSAPADLFGINLHSSASLTIDGQGHTLDGAGAYRDFFAYAGSVSIENLAIDNALAHGGNGGVGYFGGGGGAGLGGGLFVGTGAQVTLSGVTFSGDQARGGNGSNGQSGYRWGGKLVGGGGGGLGGNAVKGGGGIGAGANGYARNTPPGSGILLDAPSNYGGGGTFQKFGSNYAWFNGGGVSNPSIISLNYGSGGDGGFGGGGGGGYLQGGNGGFGGGGAGGSIGGTGGFGGGGGGNFSNYYASGGFGGGHGGGEERPGGGGGLGAGGSVFVQQGGTLIMSGGSGLSGGGVQGGGGGSYANFGGDTEGGQPGSAFGSGIFVQGFDTLNFTPGLGQTLNVADAIADQSGSGGTGSNAGVAGVVVNGPGTVVLSGDNTFSGGTTVKGAGAILSISADDNLGASASTLTLANGTELDFTSSFTLTHAINVNGDPIFNVAAGQTVTVTTPIADGLAPGDVDKTGAGTLDLQPICIKAGALADNVPTRDLWISPHHAMYFEDERGGVLIEAKDLVNGVSIVQAERADRIEYFHIELDTHDVILAEGAPSETFLDDDSRCMFHNAHEYHALYPEQLEPAAMHYCAARLEDGYEVEEVRRRIAARIGPSPAHVDVRRSLPAAARNYAVKVHRRTARR